MCRSLFPVFALVLDCEIAVLTVLGEPYHGRADDHRAFGASRRRPVGRIHESAGARERHQGHDPVPQRAPGRRWRRVAPGIYLVRAQPADWRAPLLAAQLWGGPGAVLSHDSAGALLGLGVSRAVHLSVRRSTKPPADWYVHRRAVPAERVVVSATGLLRHTDLLSTLADLAASLDDVRFEWALESALRLRLSTSVALADLGVGDGKGQAARRVRRVLALRGADVQPTGSVLETQFVQAAAVDVPALQRQVRLDLGGGHGTVFLDLAWPELGLFIEIDGHWHDEAPARADDRNRQNEIVIAMGWRPLRYSGDDLRRRPCYCATRLEAACRQAVSGAWGQGSGAIRAMAATAR